MLNGSFLRRLQEKSSLNFAEFELDISPKNLEIHMLQATKAESLTKFPQKLRRLCAKLVRLLGGILAPN